MERILDLGCGTGDSWQKLGLQVENCRIIGIDIQRDRVQIACLKYGAEAWLHLRSGRGNPTTGQERTGRFLQCGFALHGHPAHAWGSAQGTGSRRMVEGNLASSQFHVE